jgi:hypothetical protein
MGKHNKRRRSNQKRRRSSHPTPTHSAARRRRASDAPANRVPIPVPWVVLHEEGHPPLGVATDGSQTLTFEIASEERRVYAVFNAEGLLAEFIELVGPDSDEDDQLLQMFLHRRRAVSDPLFADQSLKAPAHGWRMPARRELHRFTYKHYAHDHGFLLGSDHRNSPGW